MLHLQARVHLQEIELPSIVEQELDGPGVFVSGGPGNLQGSQAHLCPQVGIEDGTGALLQHLLMPALQAALALAEVGCVSAPVQEHLDFHVSRTRDVLFEIHRRIAESVHCLRARGLELGRKPGRILHEPHPFAAPPGHGFHHDRIPDARSLGRSLFDRAQRLICSRDQRNSRPQQNGPRAGLRRHQAHRRSPRADHDYPGIDAGLGEPRVFGKKSVARMDRIATATLRRFDDLLDRKVTLGGRGRADRICLVRHPYVQGRTVRFGVDCDRRYLKIPARADNPHCNFAPVCDQDFLEHRSAALSLQATAVCSRAYGADSNPVLSPASAIRRSACGASRAAR
jgi:hypothetical protein